MEATSDLELVTQLKTLGLTPKAIAKRLGKRPSEIAPLIRAAAENLAAHAPEPKLLGCWASPHWSDGLSWSEHPEWHDLAGEPDEFPGIVCVLVAREHRSQGAAVAGYLLDPGCLGVKNALGPVTLREHEIAAFASHYFSTSGGCTPIPLELAQHLVFGAEAYAASLGFAAHADFGASRHLLGRWQGPSCIQFGHQGKPHYMPGPHDDVGSVMLQLGQPTYPRLDMGRSGEMPPSTTPRE